MRIDSHHSFSERYPLAHLESILHRNRFEGSILVAPPPDLLPHFVKAIVVPDLAMADHPKAKGILHDFGDGHIPEWVASVERRSLVLDVLNGLPVVPRLAESFPNLRISLVHLGSPPFERWEESLAEAGRHRNVCCKLSGFFRLPDPRAYVRHAMTVFTPDRLMFGSDWPNALPEHTWKENLAAFTQSIGAQPVAIREELLGGTATRFYGL